MRQLVSRARGPPPGRSARTNERLERFGGKYVKTIKIKDYYGKYQEIPVDDNLYAEWQANMIVFPIAFNCRICLCKESRPSTSRPAVGSSRKRMSGFRVRASAK